MSLREKMSLEGGGGGGKGMLVILRVPPPPPPTVYIPVMDPSMCIG